MSVAKQLGKVLEAYYQGEYDATHNQGNNSSKYKDQKKAYMNGYREGQKLRKALKA